MSSSESWILLPLLRLRLAGYRRWDEDEDRYNWGSGLRQSGA